MKIFNRYILKNLTIATGFIAIVLTMIIFLTQSLRFLEIVINAGSSGSAFWILTVLALPRAFEIILPLSLMASTLFLYNKMTIDSELVAMRGTGHSSFDLAKPAIILGLILSILLWILTLWVTPVSLSKMQQMREELKSELSNFLFKEGIFNQVGKGITVYINQKMNNGELAGLMIHDTRDETKLPSTILAKRGIIISTNNGHQVVVYDGARQEINPKTGILQQLRFERYIIELPENQSVRKRWAEPAERTIWELLNPNIQDEQDIKNLRSFTAEIHRRIVTPLLAIAFPLIALLSLLLGPTDRRGQAKKITIAIVTIIILEGIFLMSNNIARHNNIGIFIMYAITIIPIALSLLFLSGKTERLRYQIFFSSKSQNARSEI